MAEAALAGQDEPVAREMREGGLHSPPNYLACLGLVTALVDHAEGEVAGERLYFVKYTRRRRGLPPQT